MILSIHSVFKARMKFSQVCAVEGERARDFTAFRFLVASHDYASVEFYELDEVASDEVVQPLQGFVGIRHVHLSDGAVGRVDFDSTHFAYLLMVVRVNIQCHGFALYPLDNQDISKNKTAREV